MFSRNNDWEIFASIKYPAVIEHILKRVKQKDAATEQTNDDT